MAKPTIVFVPGAWHTPTHYVAITSFFESKGYPVICNQNPSCGATDPKLDNNDDADAVHKSIEGVDGDVVVIMHSYGGVVGASAAAGARNVIGLIFIAAFVLPAGSSLQDAPEHDKSWLKLDLEKRTTMNIEPQRTLYQDVEESAAHRAISHLLPQNMASFGTPSKQTSWPDIPKIYALCTDDQIMPPHAQEIMIEQMGNWLEVKRMDTGHSPWMSKEDESNAWLLSAVEKLVAHKLKSNSH